MASFQLVVTADDTGAEPTRERLGRLLGEGAPTVVFQPIVDLVTSELIGDEALARFPSDPEASPRRFFAEAAGVGMLQELEIAVVRAALGRLGSVPEGVFVSINISPGSLASPELREVLAGYDGSRVVFEITEADAAAHYGPVSQVVEELRSGGVRLAVDDTGSGTVSILSLFDVRADIIKIDVDVIHGIASDPMKEAMAFALKSLADRLGALCLAEGIETEEELGRLRRIGVQAGQGYFFGRPE